MARKKDLSKETTLVVPQTVNEVPSFMQDEEVTGVEDLKQYITPPFIKLIQKQASDELLKEFSKGDIVLSPSKAIIAEMPLDKKGRQIEGEMPSFMFTPLLFYVEWATWNSIKLKGTEPTIVYRTIDENDPIVAKARNPKLRAEPHPNYPDDRKYDRHNVEHLNFLISLRDHPLGSDPIILSFSKGNWFAGSRFASLISMRKAALYGCVFQATLALRPNPSGDYYGLDISNPDDGNSWVSEEEYEVFKEKHLELKRFHDKALIRASYEPDQDPSERPATEDF